MGIPAHLSCRPNPRISPNRVPGNPKSASLTDYKRQVRLPTDPEVLALVVNWVGNLSRIEEAETGTRPPNYHSF